MIALQTVRQWNGSSRSRQPLIKRMTGHYRGIARYELVLANVGTILHDDLIILPLQCEAAREHLLTLRGACQEAHYFYDTLSPELMTLVKPWGTTVKLRVLESQATELILLLNALELCSDASYTHVQIQLKLRERYPRMFATYTETASQLAALVVKVREQGQMQAEVQA